MKYMNELMFSKKSKSFKEELLDEYVTENYSDLAIQLVSDKVRTLHEFFYSLFFLSILILLILDHF